MKKTGEILKEYRLKRGFTLEKISKELDRSISYFSNLEKEIKPFPKKDIGDKIIKVLRISSEDIEAIKKYEDYKRTPESVQREMDSLENEIACLKFYFFEQLDYSSIDLNEVEMSKVFGDLHKICTKANFNYPKKYAPKDINKVPVYTKIDVEKGEVIYGKTTSFYQLDESIVNKGDLIAIRGLEDSLRDQSYGDVTFLVHKGTEVKNGEIGVFIINDKILFGQLKYYGGIAVVKSFSQSQDDIEVKSSDDFIIIGKVLEYKVKL